MKQQENHIVKEKTQVKPLPANIKITSGNSMKDKFGHSKTVSASIKAFKKM